MCGIAGIITNQSNCNNDILSGMLDSLVHRGLTPLDISFLILKI